MRTIIHISDMHFGKISDKITGCLLSAFSEINADLVVFSGDLTQRAKSSEFTAAKAFLSDLQKNEIQSFVIPGNHDIEPMFKPVKRLKSPYEKYKKYISENIEPTYLDDEIAIASINTVRPSNIKNGNINATQIERVKNWFDTIPENIKKIIVTHHPFDLPITKKVRKLISARHQVIEKFSKNQVALYLSGHYHESSSVITSHRYNVKNYSAIAVQAGTLSNRERGEGQTFNVVQIDNTKIEISTYLWNMKELKFNKGSMSKFKLEKYEWIRE